MTRHAPSAQRSISMARRSLAVHWALLAIAVIVLGFAVVGLARDTRDRIERATSPG